jgi:hypothetical protein
MVGLSHPHIGISNTTMSGRQNIPKKSGSRRGGILPLDISSKLVGDRLIQQLPCDISKVKVIELNGCVYTKEGTAREVVRVAQSIYTDNHYREVDELVRQNMHKKDAVNQIADKYNFTSAEGFYKQYDKYQDRIEWNRSSI